MRLSQISSLAAAKAVLFHEHQRCNDLSNIPLDQGRLLKTPKLHPYVQATSASVVRKKVKQPPHSRYSPHQELLPKTGILGWAMSGVYHQHSMITAT